jgi:hypothetical protein
MDESSLRLKIVGPHYPASTARMLPLEDVLKFRRDYVNSIPPEAALVLLTIRGFLLWLVIPIGFVAWLTYFRWARSASLGQCLGWLDVNLVAFLQRLLKRFIPRATVRRVPSQQMSAVTHRVTSMSLW